MGMFGRDASVTTTFNAKDNMSPVVRGIRRTMDQFKRDASTGFGLAAGISVFTAATQAIDFAADALRAYADDEASVAKLTTAIRENTDAWDGNTDAVEAVIRSRMRLGFSDDEQRNALAETVAVTRDLNDALAIQRTAMDLARLKGISLADSASALTKAYAGNTTALRRMGIQLRTGTKGMEAVAAVQERAAGQAASYAQTTKGAMEVSSIAFDEFKESVGGALNDALQPFFKTVVDLTNQTPDLDTALGRLTQQMRDTIEAQKDQIDTGEQQVGMFDWIGRELYGLISPQDKLISEFTNNNREMVATLGVSRREFALFVEAGLTMGMSLDQIKAKARQLQGQVGVTAPLITNAWTGLAQDVDEASADTVVSIRTIPTATMHAVTDMRETIKNGKAGIVEQFRDLAWQTKHPFAQTNYEEWLQGRMRAAIRKMKQAEKAGHPGLVEQYRQLVQDIKAELEGLPGYTSGLAADVIADLGSIGTAVTRAMGYGADGQAAPVPSGRGRRGRRGRNGRRKAMGGSFSDGDTLMVGENGPEVITLTGSGGRVTPNHHLNRPIVVNVDGRKLFEITDARAGRAIAMGGA